MHAGELSRAELELWVANRFYYQVNIPIKDALILSNCPEPDVRRNWIQRIIDHDGRDGEEGGIEAWVRLGEAMGVSRDDLLTHRRLLPGVRFAVDAYVNFCRTRPWLEAVAASLTELFAPLIVKERLAALNETRAAILRLCDGSRSVADVAATLTQRYQTEGIERDVGAFLDGLAAKGLVTYET